MGLRLKRMQISKRFFSVLSILVMCFFISVCVVGVHKVYANQLAPSLHTKKQPSYNADPTGRLNNNQGNKADNSNNAGTHYQPTNSFSNTIDEEASDFELALGDKKYKQVNLKDLVDLTLLVGARSLEDPMTMVDYSRVHYCQIYQDYYDNEYQWLKVIKGIKSDVEKKANDIPRHYFFRADIDLERYDPENKVFPFSDSSKLMNVGRIQFYTVAQNRKICGFTGFDALPTSFHLEPTNKIFLNEFAVDNEEELKVISALPKDFKGHKTIYAVFFVTINGFDVKNKNSKYSEYVDLLGEVDTIVYYADPFLEQPIKVAKF